MCTEYKGSVSLNQTLGPGRRSVIEKRSPQSKSLNNSSVDVLRPIEVDNENEAIYAVSEASDASAEYSPKKVSLEPVIYKKKFRRQGPKIKKFQYKKCTPKIFKTSKTLFSGTISSEYKSQATIQKPRPLPLFDGEESVRTSSPDQNF